MLITTFNSQTMSSWGVPCYQVAHAFDISLKSPSVNSYLFSEAFSTTKQRLSLQARLERGPTFFVKHFSFNVLSITNIPVFETISTVLEDLGPMLKKLFFHH
jgi:hypothetical protein